jgi:CBS domain-containing protein
MTCRDVMTPNPSCCVPADSAAMAAQIMKREDVGAVPIVSDYNSLNLVGIATDRDLAVKVVAEGRDAHSTRIDQVMSRNPVTCRAEDDSNQAIRMMADNQVRRIPVVDSNNSLVGIIAQADLARHESEQEVGEMVEEISQPYGTESWAKPWRSGKRSGESMEYDYTEPRSEPYTAASHSIANSLALGAACLGIGAGIMYLFDPNRGRTRRAQVRDKARSLYTTSGDAMTRTREDLRNRAKGVVSSTKTWWQHEPVDDSKLEARVRSKMGRYVSHPHAIQVSARNGHVILEGSILANEVPKLLKCVRGIQGVGSVENRLHVETMGTANPNLQGDIPRPGERPELLQKNWSPTTRAMASAVGGGMLLYGLKSRNAVGKATAGVGLGLLTRGLTNREMKEPSAVGALRRFVHV